MSTNSQPINNRKLDAQLIIDVEKVLSKLGLSQQDALLLYYEAIAKTGQIPFDLSVPNNVTLNALQDAEKNVNCKTFGNVKDLWDDLNDEE